MHDCMVHAYYILAKGEKHVAPSFDFATVTVDEVSGAIYSK